jgi:prevent-host-death family protein
MLEVSATELRNNLFGYLDKISQGETIVIRRNNEEVARMVSTHKVDWRDKMTEMPRIKMAPEEFIQPMDDLWEEYA